MEGNMQNPIPTWLSFIGRILILGGMVLVFMGVGVFAAGLICKLFYGIDIGSFDPYAVKKEDVQAIATLKWYQTLGGGIGMFLVPALLFPKVINLRVDEMIDYKRGPMPVPLLFMLVLVVVSSPLISWMYQLNQGMKFPASMADFEQSIRQMEDRAAELTKIFVAASNMQGLIINLLVVALVPAICEEFFFRGVLLKYTRQVFYYEWAAIIFSAIVFSGFHGQFYGFLPRFVFGIILGFVYVRTANIWVPVFLHFLNNSLAVLMVYNSDALGNYKIFEETYEFDWYWVVFSLLATLALLWALNRWVRNRMLNKLIP